MYFAVASNNWVPFSAIWHEAADIYLQNLATDTKPMQMESPQNLFSI